MRAQVHSQGLLGEAAGRERWHGNAIKLFEAMPAAGDEHHNTALEKIRAKMGARSRRVTQSGAGAFFKPSLRHSAVGPWGVCPHS